jgi:hypothetical protein
MRQLGEQEEPSAVSRPLQGDYRNTGRDMNLFSWLLVGHLVGDWLLQNAWMAEGKQGGLFSSPLAMHCLIYTSAVGAAFYLGAGELSDELVWLLALVWMSHWLIDGLNLPRLWGRLIGQNDIPLVRMGVDQTMHVAVLALITLGLGG